MYSISLYLDVVFILILIEPDMPATPKIGVIFNADRSEMTDMGNMTRLKYQIIHAELCLCVCEILPKR